MQQHALQFEFAGIAVGFYEAGAGLPLLLLHGPGASSRGNWSAVFGPLAERFHVYAMDLVGFGQSGRKPSPRYFRTLKAVWNARKVLQAGVTSAFDAATTYNVGQAVRDAIDSGMFEGPRFTISSKQLTNHQGLEDSFPNNMEFPPGQSAVLVKSRDELIEAIRLQVKDEVDAIKVSGSNDNLITSNALGGAAFTYEAFKLIADETHRLGRICSVHARSRDAVLDCARAGFDNLFHASYIDDEGIEACLRSNCVITPTLTLLRYGHEVGRLEAGRLADVLVVPGDPTGDIRLLQFPARFDWIFEGGRPIDRTPPAPRQRMWYERHKIFLNGLYTFDAESGDGRLVS
ncbi:alpha/beta fold hydrolase [Verticiella sediminum]|uniref:Alpha/beta fold hydrolase n=1 Tax=Verticiella sediminum TaxID=1247510 RepID=A0A556AWN2_9BURK|nr:alpha/beta fold hydrolase [Verticiella sediminum]TSH97337.1 alpha/beta fold hydrolase [Verticiella sediminum]